MSTMMVAFREIRVIVGPKLNHVFVLVTSDEHMVGVNGWHYRDTTKPTIEFLTEAFAGEQEHDPLLWPQHAPPEPSDRTAYEALE